MQIVYLFSNWRKIALQCCRGCCSTTAQFSHNCTHIIAAGPPPHPPPCPCRPSQSARLGSLCYTQCLTSSLLYALLCVCVCLPSPCWFFPYPTVSTKPFSVCISIPSLQMGSSYHFSRFHIYALLIYWAWFCSVTKLCLTLSNSMDCSMPACPVPHHPGVRPSSYTLQIIFKGITYVAKIKVVID